MLTSGFGEIVEQLRRSTVSVIAGRGGQGSGVIVRPEGIIVTNAHVVAFRSIQASPPQVELWDGTRYPAELLSRDLQRDLAVLRISRAALPAAVLGDSDSVRVGELVIAVGNPLGFLGALTTGVVHAVGRLPGLGAEKWIRANVRLAPGNSGGPLADARGRVIGINTMVAGGLGLAVPSNRVAGVLDRDGTSRRPQLGIVVRPVERGLMVLEVNSGSPAAMASLMPGDIVTGVEGKTIDSIEDFEQALEGTGEPVLRLQFLRGGRHVIRTVAVRLDSPRAAAA